MEYAENIKILDGTKTSIFQLTKKFNKVPKEAKNDEMCKQVENIYLMIMKQLRQALKQLESVCNKCSKTGHYASHCRI